MIRRFACLISSVIVAVSSVTLLLPASHASAFTNNAVNLTGHGWGHGRGMGQWGALGYAIDDSWDYTSILDHYYGGTHNYANGNPNINVRITEEDSATELKAFSTHDYVVAGRNVSGGTAVRIIRTTTNNFDMYTSGAGGCASGTWTIQATLSGPVGINPASSDPNAAQSDLIQRCLSSGTRTYRGVVQAVEDPDFHVLRTVNVVPMESYLRGVVPSESPQSWGALGGGKGMQELEAQAVASRSYAWSEGRYSYAKTCDSTSCQVYLGAFRNGTAQEASSTNDAIFLTQGFIRLFSNNSVARTEFSSSTGGYTSNIGSSFPAVADDGDDVSGNSHHTWTTSVTVSSIQSKYPQIGTLQNVAITSRNGLGDMGGRVTGMTLSGSNGSVSITGDDFRVAFGLQSNWFKVTNVASGGIGGYWITAADGGIFSFGNANFYGSTGGTHLNQPIVNMASTSNSAGYWLVASDGGIFSFGNANFYGSTGAIHLNKPVVGMARTSNNGGYWLVASDGGIFAFGNANFYGSTGGIHLNQPIVGMASTPDGGGYWLVASDGGIFSFGNANFYGSTGAIHLNKPIVGMAATPSGHGYWMVASDGGIFCFGDANFYGSGATSGATFVGMERSADGAGYLLTTSNGSIFAYGSAPDFGGMSSIIPGYNNRVLAVRATAG